MSLFTVITVCYNAASEIRKTIESVLNQSFTDFEYLIIDGNSPDKTAEIALEYSDAFKHKGIRYVVVSETDSGIYNAMNKALNYAGGEWLLYLNAGDYLCNYDVLEKVSAYGALDAGVIYGSCYYEMHGLYKKIMPAELPYIETAMAFCHQSTFIRRELMQQYRYDESYRIAADYNFFLKVYRAGVVMTQIPVAVAVFALGGASTGGDINRSYEHSRVRFENGVIDKTEYGLEIVKINKSRPIFQIKLFFKKYIPKKFLKGMQIIKFKKDGFTQ